MESLRTYFIKSVREGALLTNEQLVREAKKRKISKFTEQDASELKASWLPTAIRRNRRKVNVFQRGTGVYKLGDVQIDFAFFNEKDKRFNDGAIGFLACCETSTYRIAVLPFKSRTLQSFQKGVVRLIEGESFPSLTTIYSDREAAVFSQKFRDFVREKYGVNVRYLSRGSKAFQAELLIKQSKSRQSSTRGRCNADSFCSKDKAQCSPRLAEDADKEVDRLSRSADGVS